MSPLSIIMSAKPGTGEKENRDPICKRFYWSGTDERVCELWVYTFTVIYWQLGLPVEYCKICSCKIN